MKAIRDSLREQPLLFDGAMGTYYALRSHSSHQGCELANLSAPEEIGAIYKEYLAAGCGAIKTNTYAVNRLTTGEAACTALLRAGYAIAREAAGDEAYVFADIGPIDAPNDADPLAEYLFVIDCFLALGAEHFLLETLGTDRYLPEIARHLKEKRPDAFLLVCFAAQPDGFTRDGRLFDELIHAAAAVPEIDAVGLNCRCGARQMVDLLDQLAPIDKPLAVMPTAGYPTVRANQVLYGSDPAYFATQMATLRAQGASILGGCCGATPEHIAAVSKALRLPAPVRITRYARSSAAPAAVREDPFWEALCDEKQKPFAVELDPPENADLGKFMDGARELQRLGADVITVADCPVARVRIDSSLLSCKLRRELGVNALPHMTCRDRNLNATQALLLGLCAEGIGNVLLITGDPIPAASRDEVKSVYNFNSRKLIKYVDGLNKTVLSAPFHIFAALNVNVRNFDIQLELAKQKEENGAVGFLTQPILTEQAFENLKRARQTLRGKLLGGIMPVVSQRNALYMNSEIAGIRVDERIIALYENADRARGEELAVDISAEVARRIAPYVDGYYLITPFGRTALIGRIMERIREQSR